MPVEQYGRWISAADTTNFAQDGSPAAALALACNLHALNEVSKGVEPSPAAAVLMAQVRVPDLATAAGSAGQAPGPSSHSACLGRGRESGDGARAPLSTGGR